MNFFNENVIFDSWFYKTNVDVSYVTPNDLGAFVWLKSDAGTFVSGSSLHRWVDQSPNGYVFTQSSVSLLPTYSASDSNWNNQPSLTFATDWLTSTAAISGSYPQVSIMTIFRPTTVVSSGIILEIGTIFGAQDAQISYTAFAVWAGGVSGFNRAQQIINDGANTKQHKVCLLPYSTLQTVNAEVYTSGSLTATNKFQTGTNTTMGTKNWFIGARSGSIAPYAGSIVEIAAFPRLLTVSEIQQLYQYTSNKWGPQT